MLCCYSKSLKCLKCPGNTSHAHNFMLLLSVGRRKTVCIAFFAIRVSNKWTSTLWRVWVWF